MLTALLLAMALGAGATSSAHLRQGVRIGSLPQVPSVERSKLDARGIPDRSARETTITLSIEKEPFKAALAIRNEDQITMLLVARDGRILWRVNGPFTPAAGEALAAALDAALAGLTPAPDPRECE